MNGTIDGGGALLWGMGWNNVAVVVTGVLVLAALTKYLFFPRTPVRRGTE